MLNDFDKINDYLVEKANTVCGLKGPTSLSPVSKDKIFYLNAVLSSFGFFLGESALEYYSSLSEEDFDFETSKLINYIKKAYGGDKNYNVLFKGFPEDVPNDWDYFIKRVANHISNSINLLLESEEVLKGTMLSCGHYVYEDLFDLNDFGACPVCQMQVPELSGERVVSDYTPSQITKMKELHFIDKMGLEEKVKNIVMAKSSVSKEDLKFVESVFNIFDGLNRFGGISFKENMAFYCSLFVKNGKKIDYEFETITDVLRVANAVSGGDVYLQEQGSFKFKRSVRKIFLEAIDSLNQKEEYVLSDMFKYRKMWLAFGEKVHVGEFKNKYKKAFKYFNVLRNEDFKNFYNCELEKIIEKIKSGKDVDYEKSMRFVSSKAGIFARYLDFFLTNAKNKEDVVCVVDAFEKVAPQLSNKMLLELEQYFSYLKVVGRGDFRHFIPKNKDGKIQTIKEERDLVSVGVLDYISSIAALALSKKMSESENKYIVDNYKGKKVYIDESLKSILIPFTLRDTSKGTVSLERGSRVKIGSSDSIIRLFTYWKESMESGRVDVDISAAFFNVEGEYLDDISYYSYSGRNYATFSGDIQSAPKGAAEFIDLDMGELRKDKGNRKYILLNNFSYTGQNFSTFDCISGAMVLDKVSSLKDKPIFQINNVDFKVDSKKASRLTTMFAYDIETNEMIWLDSSCNVRSSANAVNEKSKIENVLDFAIERGKYKPNVYNLFKKQLIAKNIVVVDSLEESDLILDLEYAKDTANILSNWVE